MDVAEERTKPWGNILRAWGVHLYTSLGLMLGLLMVIAIAAGRPQDAFLLMALACVVDTTDGAMARSFKVTKWAPRFDGRKLDDISDYITYTFAPMFFVYRFELIPSGWIVVLFVVLLASAYGFCQEAAKTDDGFFTGFPSYWNVAVFYFYVLKWPPIVVALSLLCLAMLVFVPIKYLSSKTRPMRRVHFGLGILWGCLVLFILARLDQISPLWAYISLLFPLYYVAVSVYLQLRPRFAER